MRNSWGVSTGGSPTHSSAPAHKSGPNVGGCFRFVLVAAVLGGIGYAVWKVGPEFVEKFRQTTDAENAAGTCLYELPVDFPSEQALREQAGLKAGDALAVHHARKYKWYVALGPGGSPARVVRDDQFTDKEKQFFNGVLAEIPAAGPPLGQKYDSKTRPLGLKWKNFKIDGKPWRVVVGWRDPPQ